VKFVSVVRASAALAAALALAGCGKPEAPAAPETPPAPILDGQQLRYSPDDHPQLKLIDVTRAEAADKVVTPLPARLVWDESRTQRIYPPFAGRVSAIRADVGQAVQPGAVLAELASPDFAVAQADTAKAESDALLAAKTLARQHELLSLGIAARTDVEQAEADDARARAEVARAHARTRMYGGGSRVNQQLALTAGIRGVVVERNLNPGQELRPDQFAPGTPPLFTLSDPASLWVLVDAREGDVDALRPGARFTFQVAALPGQTFEAQVTAAADVIDPVTRTIKIRGAVANPERRLKAEMLGAALVEHTHPGGVRVPASAVTLRGTDHQVVVQVRPGVFERRRVEMADEGAREVVLARGVQPGEMVVSGNTLLVLRQFGLIERQPESVAAAASSAEQGRR
jgi:cobalt-zinc-cadmium efflux system membrane fusion protein